MLEKVIKQLPLEKYEMLLNELRRNNGEKISSLLEIYRSEHREDSDIIMLLDLTVSSYHTLRSRLFSRLQEFLFHIPETTDSKILHHVFCIPEIVNNYPKETSISILKHLESELKQSDLPEYLISVYHALKKLYSDSEKYYYYDQLYNKCIAYTLAQNKAEDLLNTFCKNLAYFLLSEEENYLSLLLVCLQELYNLTELYDSRKLNFTFKIAYLNYCIFVDPNFNRYLGDKTTEEILNDCREFSKQPGFRDSKSTEIMVNYLTYQFYHRLNLQKNIPPLLEQLLKSPLPLNNLCSVTVPSYFMFSLLEMIANDSLQNSELENYIKSVPEPDESSESDYIWYYLAKAIIKYYNGDNTSTYSNIQTLIHYTPLKKFSKTETEIKLFYVFLLILENKPDPAESILRNIHRSKKDEIVSERKKQFIIMLNTSLNGKSKNKQAKIFEAYKIYNLLSETSNNFLPYIKFHERHILELSIK